MGTYEVYGTVYSFPDDYSEEDVLRILREQKVLEPDVPKATALPRAATEVPVFAPEGETAEAARQKIVDDVYSEMVARSAFTHVDVKKATEDRLTQMAVDEQKREREKLLHAGAEPQEAGSIPIFRASRIKEIPIPAVTQDGKYLTERLYIDPKTGTPNIPTTSDEVRESFAQQPILGEESARQASANIIKQQKDIEARILAGETIDKTEYAGPLFSGILSKPDGTGTSETGLAAALRSTLGWISAAAAEGYFRGLGYEVDEDGVPLDEGDLGYEIALTREKMNRTYREVTDLAAEGFFALWGYEVDEKGLPKDKDVLTAAIDWTRHLRVPTTIAPSGLGGLWKVPMPGMATTSQTKKTTTFDPEARRAASDIPVPNPFKDPLGFMHAETRRIAQNVAAGRSLGDEFMDAPAVQEAYENLWGNPDAAFYGGSLGEIFIPAGPGTAMKAAKGTAKAATGTKAAQVAAKAAISAAEAAKDWGSAASAVKDGGSAASKAIARGTKLAVTAALAAVDAVEAVDYASDIAGPAVKRAAKRAAAAALGLGADAVSVVVPGRASDGRVVRRIAEKSLIRLGYQGEDLATLKAAIKPTSDTADDIAKNLRDPIQKIEAARGGSGHEARTRVMNLIRKNVPDDMVMVTENVAVPRALAPAAKKVTSAARRDLLRKTPKRLSDGLRALAAEAEQGNNTKLANSLRSTADIVLRDPSDKMYKIAAKRAQAFSDWKQFDTSDYGKMFINTAPGDVAARYPYTLGPLGEQLAKYGTWDDVPSPLRRIVTTMVEEAGLVDDGKLQALSRVARDLTAAQVAVKQTGISYGEALKSPVLDSMTTRRFRALSRPLETETVAVSQARQQIRASAKTVLPRISKRLNQLANEKGSVDEAMDILLDEALSAAAENFTPETAWMKVFEALYGGEGAKKAMGQVVLRDLSPVVDGEFVSMPTIKAAMEIDSILVKNELLPGLARSGGRIMSMLTEYFAPDFHKAFLKVAIDESIKKGIAKSGREVEGVLSGYGDSFGIFAPSYRRGMTDSTPGRMKVQAYADWDIGGGPRVRNYDTSASHAERVLAENGEEFAELIETISPRARAGLIKMAQDGYDFLITGVVRNMARNAKYGYVIPNLPYLSYRMVEAPIISLVTVGLPTTARASRRLLSRRLFGGGLMTDEGYYSPQVLGKMAEDFGIGYTRVESERVGTLADDLIRDAHTVARKRLLGKAENMGDWVAEKAVGSPDLAFSLRHPLDKSFWTRTAEALERSYRQSVFEVRLLEGDTPQAAAETARRSQFDYDAVPDLVRTQAARYFASAANAYALHSELVQAVMTNPSKARMTYKALMAQQRVRDPYGVHGDKGLTALGIWHDDSDDAFYGPDAPIFTPVETILGWARHANLLIDDILYAYQTYETVGDIGEVAFSAGERTAQALADDLLPEVLAAYDRFGEDDGSEAKKGPAQITDEKMFWAAAIVAHHRGPEEWATFLRWFKPEIIKPPAGMGVKDSDWAWSKQPPEGTPHILMGRDEQDVPIYAAFKPSREGLRNITIIRNTPLAMIERLFPIYAAAVAGDVRTDGEGNDGDIPEALYPEGIIGSGIKGALMQSTLTPAPTGTPDQLRAKQAEQIRKMKEDM